MELQKTCAKWQETTNNLVWYSKHFASDRFKDKTKTAIVARLGIKNKDALSLMPFGTFLQQN